MSDEDKTREQLLEELQALRTRVGRLEKTRPESEATGPIRTATASASEQARLREQSLLSIERLPLVFVLLDAHYRVLEWNPAAEKTFGYRREEALGRVGPELIVPASVTAQLQEVSRRLEAGDMDAHSINDNRTRDGRVITCEWFNTPLFDADGRFAGVICLGQDITKRKQAERALEQYTTRLQALSRRLVQVQEEERRHLARELHDGICQILTSVAFAFEAGASAPPEMAAAKMAEARTLLDEALTGVRELSFDLRPALLDHLGLLPALRCLVERYTRRTGVRVNFKHAGLEQRAPPEVETAAYRIVQEALSNVARHARVQDAAVRLWVEVDTLAIQIEDQGVGFEAEAVLAAPRSNGLPEMRERALLLGGRLILESTPGGGSHVLAELPLHNHPGRQSDEHFHPPG
jgi:PAS domain S-box-containing protein